MEKRPAGALRNRRAGLGVELDSQVLPGEFVLPDGAPAMIWPLLPTDAETLHEVFRRLSEDSRRSRFLGMLRCQVRQRPHDLAVGGETGDRRPNSY